MSIQLSDRRETKELKVLELHDRGYSYRKIAKEVHLSLREVTKYIQTISNKRKSQSLTSINDEIVLEYRVNLLRSEVRDLELERQSLKNELVDLRAQKYNLQIRVRAKQSELDVLKTNLENEMLKDIFTE
jgi:predicted transcriptional regulator